jgi:hypothetical protein
MIADGSTAVPKGAAARFPTTITRSRPHVVGETVDQWWRLQGEERRPQASPSLAATGRSSETITIQPHAHLMSTIGTNSSTTPSRRKVVLLSVAVIELSLGYQSPRLMGRAARRGMERIGMRSKWGGGDLSFRCSASTKAKQQSIALRSTREQLLIPRQG